MITQIEAHNFCCLKDVHQTLDSFQVLIGPNATDKSTFLDVVEFISEALNENLLGAIGKRTADFRDLLHKRQGKSFTLAIALSLPEQIRNQIPETNGLEIDGCHYRIEIGQSSSDETIQILSETFEILKKTEQLKFSLISDSSSYKGIPEVKEKTVISKTESGNAHFVSETSGWNFSLRLGPSKLAFANLPEDEEKFPATTWAKQQLMDGIRYLQLNSRKMRSPCPALAPVDFALDGSNLPKVIQRVEENYPNRFKQWLGHIRQALPDVEDLTIRERPEDRSLYIVLHYRGDYEIPSWRLSDGTLRILALTLIPYTKESGIYLIEEPENGVHPIAIETIFQSLSSAYDSQILLATHSPVILSLVEPKQILCFSLKNGATQIHTGSENPTLLNWKGMPDLGVLFASGVL